MTFVKRLLGASIATLSLLAFSGPAQALTDANSAPPDVCLDGDAWTWSIENPARYGAEPNEAVVGLSDATRTVTIHAPADCSFDTGDLWRVGNGYFSAEGSISAAEDGDTSDSDVVKVEKPASNSTAGDELGVRIKVSHGGHGTGWEIDESNVDRKLAILRRTEFNYGGTVDRANFSPEPYTDTVAARSTIKRANWSAGRYDSYAGRNIHVQANEHGDALGYVDVGETQSGGNGVIAFSFQVSAAGTPAPGSDFDGRLRYYGNLTSGGTTSNGDHLDSAE